MENRVNPMIVTDNKSGEKYTLDFSRESVRFAEDRGFKIGELEDFPQTNIPALWYFAFRKNHKSISRAETDAILNEAGGLKAAEIARLVALYMQPTRSLIIGEDEERKNQNVTVEL